MGFFLGGQGAVRNPFLAVLRMMGQERIYAPPKMDSSQSEARPLTGFRRNDRVWARGPRPYGFPLVDDVKKEIIIVGAGLKGLLKKSLFRNCGYNKSKHANKERTNTDTDDAFAAIGGIYSGRSSYSAYE
mgnify:CR=1 FL=1